MSTPRPIPAARTPSLCEERGYHGPFINLEKYAAFPEWQGMGDCSVCGTTRDVARQETRRREVLARRGFVLGKQPLPEPG